MGAPVECIVNGQGKYITRETSQEYALQKAEEYKAWDARYQRWKGELKHDFTTWGNSQMKRVMG
jgi:hypothetical protein